MHNVQQKRMLRIHDFSQEASHSCSTLAKLWRSSFKMNEMVSKSLKNKRRGSKLPSLCLSILLCGVFYWCWFWNGTINKPFFACFIRFQLLLLRVFLTHMFTKSIMKNQFPVWPRDRRSMLEQFYFSPSSLQELWAKPRADYNLGTKSEKRTRPPIQKSTINLTSSKFVFT